MSDNTISLGFGIVGGVVGAFFGNPALGYAVGSVVGSTLFPPELPSAQGPRLDNLKVTTSGYGVDIPRVYGQATVGGHYIVSTDLQEHAHTEEAGGKGGQPTQKRTTYTYTIDCAVLFCEGSADILKIYADGEELINFTGLQGYPPELFPVLDHLTKGAIVSANQNFTSMNIYTGTEDQLPDPVVESIVGAGNASGFRGYTYVVFEGLQLKKYGNRPPTIAALIASSSQLSGLSKAADVYLQRNPSGTTDDDWFWKIHAGSLIDYDTESAVEVDKQLTITAGDDGLIFPKPYTFTTWTPGLIDKNSRAWIHAAYCEYKKVGWFEDPADGSVAYKLPKGSTLIVISWSDAMGAGGGQTTRVKYLHKYPLFKDGGDLNLGSSLNGIGHQLVSPENRRVICRQLYNKPYGENLWFCDVDSDDPERLIAVDTSILPGGYNPAGNEAFAVAIYGQHLYYLIDAQYLVYLDLDTNTQVYIDQVPRGTTSYAIACYIHATKFYYLRQNGSDYDVCAVAHGSAVKTFEETAQSFGFGSPSFAPLQVVNNWLYLAWYYSGTFTLYRIDLDQANVPLQAEMIDSFVSNLNSATLPLTLAMAENVGGLRSWYNSGSPDNIYYSRWYVFGSTPGADPTLDTIVAAICQEAGLQAGQYDVTDLAGTSVRGYVRDRRMEARRPLEQLMNIFRFMVRQEGSVLKFVDLTTLLPISVDADDLRTGVDQAQGDLLPFTTTPDFELPKAIDFSYMDAGRDFEVNTMRALRDTSVGENKKTLNIPVVFTADEAAQVADILLSLAWTQRRRYKDHLPMDYIGLLPGDAITVTVNGISHVILLTRVGYSSLISFEGIPYSAAVLTNDAAAGDTGANQVGSGLQLSGPTIMDILDINAIRSGDTGPGYYIAVSGFTSSWRGCALYRSVDNGETWQFFDSFTEQTAIGKTITALGGGESAVWDYIHTVDVQILGAGTLASASGELAVLNGANAALIGNEILQFKDVTALGDNLYRLSGFLRGRQGTEPEMDGHYIGERFVLLQTAGVRFVPTSINDLNTPRRFAVVSIGESLDENEYQELSYSGRILKPFTVWDVEAARATAGDLTVEFIRRARLNNAWVDFINAPLDEDREVYEIDVMNGGAVLATYSSDDDPAMFNLANRVTFSYSHAQQTADGVPDPANIDLRIYQLSQQIGRGHRKEVTV